MKTRYSLSNRGIGSFATSAGLHDSFSKSSRKLVDLDLALNADTTKTPKMRKLHYLKSYKIELDKINSGINSTRASVVAEMKELNARVEAQSKILGTTDQLILQGHMQAIQQNGVSASKVVEISRKTGNADPIRAMLLSPSAMYNDQFDMERDFLYKNLERIIMGDDHPKLGNLIEKRDALNNLENEILIQYGMVKGDIEEIEDKIVPPVAA